MHGKDDALTGTLYSDVYQAGWMQSMVRSTPKKQYNARLTSADIVLRAWNDLETFGGLTLPTLNTIDAYGGFDNNVIYAILHEAIYCQG